MTSWPSLVIRSSPRCRRSAASSRAFTPGITEQIEWNAPTFSFDRGYLVTFKLRATDRVHVVFHDPEVLNISGALLEGSLPGRRMTYFADMSEVTAAARRWKTSSASW